MLDAGVRVAVGLLIGTFGTLIGAGGGFLLVPILLLGYGFSPPDAVGTSLTLVCLNALSGTVAYVRQRRVDFSLGWPFAAATVPGAVGGAFLTRTLSADTFSLGFGVALLGISVLLFAGKTAPPSRRAVTRALVDSGGETHVYAIELWRGIGVSVVVGFLSSLLGIGGGIIHVPFLIVALGLPVHIATATSHFVLSISAAVGAATYLGLRHVQLDTAAWMGFGVLLGAQVGARISLRTSSLTIRRILAVSLFGVGARMVWHAVRLFFGVSP